MNNQIEPIDPLVTNNNFFYADQKMLDILVNNDIQDYLDYVREKQKKSKIQPPEPTSNKQLLDDYKQERQNKHKKIMLESIWTNIITLENTINKFKF